MLPCPDLMIINSSSNVRASDYVAYKAVEVSALEYIYFHKVDGLLYRGRDFAQLGALTTHSCVEVDTS
jgi:hypothetical protein